LVLLKSTVGPVYYMLQVWMFLYRSGRQVWYS